MPACQVTERGMKAATSTSIMCEREEGCHFLSTACLKSCNGPMVSPAGTLLSLSAASVVVFPVLYRCWEQLTLPFLIILSHLGNEDSYVCLLLHGAAVHHSQQLADTPALPFWGPICSLWNCHPWKWSKSMWMGPLWTWSSGEHGGAVSTAGFYDLGSFFHLNDSVILWIVVPSHRLLSLHTLAHQVNIFILVKLDGNPSENALWKLEFPQQKYFPQ